MLNLGLCGGGAHPFTTGRAPRVPGGPLQVDHQALWLPRKQFTVFGEHVHLGCANRDELFTFSHAHALHAAFIALSASSPFSQGEDTSFQSRGDRGKRVSLSGTCRSSRLAAFLEYFETMRGYGIVEGMKDFYWDIRPKPEYGTIEIRVCDTPLTVRRTALLRRLRAALAAWLLRSHAEAIRRRVQ